MSFKINTIIIGSQKSGTSSLLGYLSSHPDIISHQSAEFPFFSDDYIYQRGIDEAIENTFTTNLKVHQKNHILCKSASVLHTYDSFQRIYIHNPNIKLICILRNPIQRALSAFWYAKRCGYEKRESFYEALQSCSPLDYTKGVDKRNCSYLFAGEYFQHIKQLLEYFNRDQLDILLFEDLKNMPEAICNKYFSENNLSSFNIDSSKVHNSKKLSRFPSFSKFLLERNQIKKYLRSILPLTKSQKLRIKKRLMRLNEIEVNLPEMSIKEREFLLNYYSTHNLELSKFLNRDLSHWNL